MTDSFRITILSCRFAEVVQRKSKYAANDEITRGFVCWQLLPFATFESRLFKLRNFESRVSELSNLALSARIGRVVDPYGISYPLKSQVCSTYQYAEFLTLKLFFPIFKHAINFSALWYFFLLIAFLLQGSSNLKMHE